MKSFLILCLVILFGFTVSASGIEQQHKFRLNGVRFVGIKSVSKKKLSKTLAAQVPPKLKFWHPKPVITVEDLKDDILRIKQFYKDHGYYQAQVVYNTEAVNDKGAQSKAKNKATTTSAGPLLLINVTYTITEGPPVLISAINLTMTPTKGTLTEEGLLNELTLKSGQIFETSKYREAKKIILKTLGNKGYPFAELSGQVTVNTIKNSARVSFALDPGRPYTVGPISILKNEARVKDVVILRAINFKQGEAYSADKIDKGQHNLYDLDIFRLALIKPEKPEPDAESVPMSVQLKPKKRQNLKLGIGYGTEDGFRVKGAWTYRNIWGWGGKLSLSAKRSDLIENVQADYTQPYFLDAKNFLSSKAGFKREKSVSYTNRKIFDTVSLERKFRPNWSWSSGYNLEINDLEEIKITDQEELEWVSSETNYFISSILAGLTYDTTDNTLYPKKGTAVFVLAEWASRLVGSQISFIKPSIELKRYESLPGSLILAGRFRFETVKSDDPAEIPIFKRLFLGGSNSVRGYGYQELPPLDENGTPLGGRTSINANLELRRPLYKKVSGVIFLDMGLLDKDDFQYDLSDMRYSCGAGIRYNTIIGPIRLDFGYKLNPPDRGPEEDLWRIHLNIGQAF